MNEMVFKVKICDKSILEEMSKLSFFIHRYTSRIDGYPFYEVDLLVFHRYIKIKKIKGEDVSIYETILENLMLVSSLEDHIAGFHASNPTKTSIIKTTII
jgi:hypothetical protein